MTARRITGRDGVLASAMIRRMLQSFPVLSKALLVLSLSLAVLAVLRGLYYHSNHGQLGLLPSSRPPSTSLQDLLRHPAQSMPPSVQKVTRESTPNDTNTTAASEGTKTGVPKNLVNPHPFTYLINPRNACTPAQSSHTEMLFYVYSAPANFKRRVDIRHTWGNRSLLQSYNATLVFVMGMVRVASLMESVKMENRLYGDILQEDFLDSYHNLTYKGIAALKWAASFCSQAAFILKTDDDVLVNTAALMNYIHSVVEPRYGRHRLVVCNLWMGGQPHRDPRSKWHVSTKQWSATHYPHFCQGMAYLFSGDMASLLYEASLSTPFLYLEDVYVTGCLVQRVGVKHKSMNHAYTSNAMKFSNGIFFLHGEGRLLVNVWKSKIVAKSPASART